MSTADTIRPLVIATYGDGSMPHAFVEHLAEKIDAFEARWEGDSRLEMMFQACWAWFSGGGTAEHLAQRIETALLAAEREAP